MHSFQNFIVRLIPNHPLETRIWKLVVRALLSRVVTSCFYNKFVTSLFLQVMRVRGCVGNRKSRIQVI